MRSSIGNPKDPSERHVFELRLFMLLLLVNNVVQKMRTRVTNTISLCILKEY